MQECVCGHDFDDHESAGDGMLPLCAWCGCIGPKGIPDWIQKMRKNAAPGFS